MSRHARHANAKLARNARLKQKPPLQRAATVEQVEQRLMFAAYQVIYGTDVGLPGVGTGAGNAGDLRYCLNKAILDQQADTITFAANLAGQTIQLSLLSGLQIQATPANNPANIYGPSSFFVGSGDNITIDGSNAPGVDINGNGYGRLFTVFGGSLSLVNLKLTGGVAQGFNGGNPGGGGAAGMGGAVFVDGATFTAQGCTFSNDKAIGGNGGTGGYNGGSTVFGGGGGGGGLGASGSNHNGDDGGNGGGKNAGQGVAAARLPGNHGINNIYVNGAPSHSVNGGGFGGGGGGGGRSSFRQVTFTRNNFTGDIFNVFFNGGPFINAGTGARLYVGGTAAAGGFGGGGGGVGAAENIYASFHTYGGAPLKYPHSAVPGAGGYGGGGGGSALNYNLSYIEHHTGPGGRRQHTHNGGFGGGGGGTRGGNETDPFTTAAPLFSAGGGGGGAGFGGAIFSNGGSITLNRDAFANDSANGGAGGTADGPNAFMGQAGSGMGGGVFAVNGTIRASHIVASGDAAQQGGADFYLDSRTGQGIKGNGTINAAIGDVTSTGGSGKSIAGKSYTTLNGVIFDLESPAQLTYNAQPQPVTVDVGPMTIYYQPLPTLDGVAPTLTYAQVNADGTLTNLGAAAPTTVGHYKVSATFPDTTHYMAGQSGLFSFSIVAEKPTVTVSDAGGLANYTNSYPATAAVTGADGVARGSLEGVTPTFQYYQVGIGPTSGAPNFPGTFIVTASFAGSADYSATTATATFVLTPANPSLVVTTDVDENNGTSDPSFGAGTSLREAVLYAEALNATDGLTPTITFDPSLDGTTIRLTIGEINLSGVFSIAGPGFTQLTVDGLNQSRVFSLASNAAVTLSGLTIKDGNAGPGDGGGIENFGSLTLNSVALIDNTAASGGAIANDNQLTLNNCELLNNSATGTAGGLFNNGSGAPPQIDSTLIADNTAPNAPDVSALVNSQGYNTVDNGTGSSGWIPPGQINSDKIGGTVSLTGLNPTITVSAPNSIADGSVYQAARVSVLDPYTDASIVGAGAVSLSYYSGTLNPSQITAATPLSGAPSALGSYTVVASFAPSNPSAYNSAVSAPAYFSIVSSTLDVSTTSDENDGNYSFGHLSLREAIQLADSGSGAVISFDPSLFTSGPATIDMSPNGDPPSLNTSMTIQGPGANLLSISGTASQSFFNVLGANVSISGLSFNSVRASYAVLWDRNNASATLTNCSITNNFSYNFLLENVGTLTLAGCTLANNICGTSVIDNSTFSGTATRVLATNCTITGNSANDPIIENDGTSSTLINCTIAGNSDSNGTLVSLSGSQIIGNSIVADGSVAGSVSSLGGNLIAVPNNTLGLFLNIEDPISAADFNSLANSSIPNLVRQGFATRNISLDQNAIVSTVIAGNEWTIADGASTWNAIVAPSGFQFEASVPSSVYVASLNSGVVPTALQQAFANQSIALSNNVQVTTTASGQQWVISDSSNNTVFIAVTNDANSLNIYSGSLNIYNSRWGATDQLGSAAAPLNVDLGPLQNNGGPTLTMALLAGSPALGAGVVSVATNAELTIDQRGLSRLYFNTVDAGAVEVVRPPIAPALVVTAGNTTYDGLAQGVTSVSVNGQNSATLASLTQDSGTLSIAYYQGQGTLGIALGANAPLAAGTYTAVASYSSDNPLYASAASTPVTFNIAPEPITVTANALSKTVGMADPSLTYSVTGGTLDGGDTLVGSLTRVPGEAVGNYNITQDTLSANSNYTLGFVNSVLFITSAPAPITTAQSVDVSSSGPPVTASTSPAVSTAPQLAATASGFDGGLTVAQYQASPVAGFASSGTYFDAYDSSANLGSAAVQLAFQNLTPNAPLFWWNGTVWSPVLDGQGNRVNADGSGNATVTLNSTTSPTAAGLAGAVIQAGAFVPTLTSSVSPATVSLGSTTTLETAADLENGYNPTGALTFELYVNGGSAAIYTETVAVNGNGVYATQTGFTPSAGALAGGYQWEVTYNSTTGDNSSINNHTDSGGQVHVTPASPTITGVLSSNIVQLGTDPVTLTDSATLAGAVNPSGKIVFTLYLDDVLLDTETVDATANGIYTTPAGYMPPITGAVAGLYQWNVFYNLDGSDLSNSSASDLYDPNQQVVVLQQTPTLTATANLTQVTLPSSATLTDSVAVSNSFFPTGSITFSLYTNASGAITLVDTETVPVNGNGTYATPTGYALPTTGAVAGGYGWNVSYAGDSNNIATFAANNSSQFTSATLIPSISSTIGSKPYDNTPFAITASAAAGSYATDSQADITSSGTVGDFTIQFYSGATTGSAPTTTAPSNAGTYAYTVTYAGDTYYSAIASQTFTYTITPAQPTVAVADNGGTYKGSAYFATGSITGVAGANLGTPVFSYYFATDLTLSRALPGAPSGVGSYVVVASYSASGNYASASAMTGFNITSALTDITSQIKVSRGGFVYNAKTKTYSQTLTITNTGAALTGPLTLVLGQLTNGTLANATGFTDSADALSAVGSAYLSLSITSLAQGAGTTVVLQFNATSAPTYNIQWLLGVGQF